MVSLTETNKPKPSRWVTVKILRTQYDFLSKLVTESDLAQKLYGVIDVPGAIRRAIADFTKDLKEEIDDAKQQLPPLDGEWGPSKDPLIHDCGRK